MLKLDRIGIKERVRLRFWMAVLVACFPVSCASPGREDYAAASYHAEQARKNDALVQQHEAAIRLFDREGDQMGVDISREAAEEARQQPPAAPTPPPINAPVAGFPPATADTPAPAPAPIKPPVTARVPGL